MNKKYFLIPACSILILAMAVMYFIHVLLDSQKKHVFDMLNNQARISGINLQDYAESFEDDFTYAMSTIPFFRLLKSETIDYALLNQIKRFYSKYQDIISSIKLYDKNNYRTLINEDGNYFNVSSLKQNNIRPQLIKMPDIKRTNEVLYRFREIRHQGEIIGTIEIQILLSNVINHELKNSYITDRFWPWCIDNEGNIVSLLFNRPILKSGGIKVGNLSEIVRDIAENYQGSVKHDLYTANGDTIKILSAYYPITLFGENFGIIVSSENREWFDRIKAKLLGMVISFLLIIILMSLLFFYIISHRSKAENKLVESRAQVNKIIENVQAGLVIIDEHTQTILFANKVAADMMRTNCGNIVGKICHQFICPAEVGNCPVLHQNKEVEHSEKVLLTVYGERRDILKTVTKIEFEGKPCLLETFVDITDLKKQTALAEELAQKSEAANRAKSEFLANMSHEIRTPMTAIIGLSRLALATDLTSKQRDYIKKIDTSAQTLLQLLNSILDYSKIEADKLAIEKVEFEINTILAEVKDLISLIAMGKEGVGIVFDIDPTIPKILIGDPLRLKQILLNITYNAVKFTEQGGIAVSVAVHRRKAEYVALQFSVKDTGIGMSEAQCGELFQPFSQVDASITRNYGGTGLGLTISKRLIELLKGDIRVESTPGKGSEFIFTIEFELGCIACEAAAQFGGNDGLTIKTADSDPIARNRLDPIRGSRILLVEDNEINQQIIREVLEGAGLEVIIADNGRAGIDWVRKVEFDAVLMDVQMPVMSGYQVSCEIRKDARFKKLPIIAITAAAMVQDRKKALEAGMDDHLGKPINFDELFNILLKWIKPKNGNQVRGKLRKDVDHNMNENKMDLPASLPGIDMKTALDRIGGNRPLFGKLLRKFYANHADSVQRIKTALESEDRETAILIAHTLKGLSGTIGARALQDAAKDLEAALKDEKEDLHDLFALVSRNLEEVLSGLTILEAGPVEKPLIPNHITGKSE